MDISNIDNDSEVSKPRPGHADLAGALKFGHSDIRNILERASARETAARTAVGGLLANSFEIL
ncbi:MAG: chorismate synthase [Halanaerobiales bacterium]|nr:chorismate synthase [Halanaerobiales bacterium]